MEQEYNGKNKILFVYIFQQKKKKKYTFELRLIISLRILDLNVEFVKNIKKYGIIYLVKKTF